MSPNLRKILGFVIFSALVICLTALPASAQAPTYTATTTTETNTIPPGTTAPSALTNSTIDTGTTDPGTVGATYGITPTTTTYDLNYTHGNFTIDVDGDGDTETIKFVLANATDSGTYYETMDIDLNGDEDTADTGESGLTNNTLTVLSGIDFTLSIAQLGTSASITSKSWFYGPVNLVDGVYNVTAVDSDSNGVYDNTYVDINGDGAFTGEGPLVVYGVNCDTPNSWFNSAVDSQTYWVKTIAGNGQSVTFERMEIHITSPASTTFYPTHEVVISASAKYPNDTDLTPLAYGGTGSATATDTKGNPIELYDDGAHNDGAANDGVWGGTYTVLETDPEGIWTIEVRVQDGASTRLGISSTSVEIRRPVGGEVVPVDKPAALTALLLRYLWVAALVAVTATATAVVLRRHR